MCGPSRCRIGCSSAPMIVTRSRSPVTTTCYCANVTSMLSPPSGSSRTPASTSERTATLTRTRLPDPAQPGAGFAEVRVTAAGWDRALGAVPPCVGPEVAHVSAYAVQGRQRVAHAFLGDMSFAVDREAVLPDASLGRS